MTYLTLRNKSLDRLFDDFWSFPRATAAEADTWSPAAEIDEEEAHYRLALDVPGVKKEDIAIELNGDQVVISGERKTEEKKGLYSERRFGRFERAFVLPRDVDASKIEAKYEDGVLRVTVPKAESAKARQIKVG